MLGELRRVLEKHAAASVDLLAHAAGVRASRAIAGAIFESDLVQQLLGNGIGPNRLEVAGVIEELPKDLQIPPPAALARFA